MLLRAFLHLWGPSVAWTGACWASLETRAYHWVWHWPCCPYQRWSFASAVSAYWATFGCTASSRWWPSCCKTHSCTLRSSRRLSCSQGRSAASFGFWRLGPECRNLARDLQCCHNSCRWSKMRSVLRRHFNRDCASEYLWGSFQVCQSQGSKTLKRLAALWH